MEKSFNTYDDSVRYVPISTHVTTLSKTVAQRTQTISRWKETFEGRNILADATRAKALLRREHPPVTLTVRMG
jgi:hypothetical protein